MKKNLYTFYTMKDLLPRWPEQATYTIHPIKKRVHEFVLLISEQALKGNKIYPGIFAKTTVFQYIYQNLRFTAADFYKLCFLYNGSTFTLTDRRQNEVYRNKHLLVKPAGSSSIQFLTTPNRSLSSWHCLTTSSSSGNIARRISSKSSRNSCFKHTDDCITNNEINLF